MLATMGQRTAPRLWCARMLDSEVNRMVAIEVAMAIFTAMSPGTPRWLMMMVMKGTSTMPPPMPSSPAMKPPKVPRHSSSTTRLGLMPRKRPAGPARPAIPAGSPG